MERIVMSVADVQKAMHIGKDKAYRLFKQKSFPSFQFDGKYMIVQEDFEKWLRYIQKIPGKNYVLDPVAKE